MTAFAQQRRRIIFRPDTISRSLPADGIFASFFIGCNREGRGRISGPQFPLESQGSFCLNQFFLYYKTLDHPTHDGTFPSPGKLSEECMRSVRSPSLRVSPASDSARPGIPSLIFDLSVFFFFAKLGAALVATRGTSRTPRSRWWRSGPSLAPRVPQPRMAGLAQQPAESQSAVSPPQAQTPTLTTRTSNG